MSIPLPARNEIFSKMELLEVDIDANWPSDVLPLELLNWHYVTLMRAFWNHFIPRTDTINVWYGSALSTKILHYWLSKSNREKPSIHRISYRILAFASRKTPIHA